ncbi:glycosyltransferase family 4 protein [Zobellia galactanivorans]|uniref:Mannosyltransferase, family GT4 n=1 Tax=Zobellia galactanivorans (strain DSM 12802 / CCUG 47099 / CIP 106680 / NCIMB 13871 / Dsij) TaxID=63186 RepID=G0LAA4_ZOBGA|nr:glycosyltransferase family 1 protein [Zobellia galactanivorans]CAZ95178.1 Mannosyltransferase, family GT4 [Zobellia galactanivorans]
MKINYFFRHPNVGHSIHRVFRTIIGEIKKTKDVTMYEVPSEGSMPADVVKNLWFTYSKREKKAIHHVTGHIHDVLLALIGVKTVLTVHDLVFLDNVKNPFKRLYKWLFWLYFPVKIADVVVCISNQTKQNILQKIKTDKLRVIYNAIDPIFVPVAKPFNQEKPIILHIGTGWNKNLDRTIEALSGISCHLRIIGKLKVSQVALLEKYKTDYSNQCNLTDEEIRDEYKSCDIVNFPSMYEGFGMPVIEGQMTGRVVITSNIEPLIEVAADAAVLVNPEDVSSIRDAYETVISNESYRINLIEKGLRNAERFSVEYIAQQYLELYKTL